MYRILTVCSLLFALLVPAVSAEAQPTLNFKRVTVNWPTIELYFQVGCGGEPRFDMSKEDFRIYENGERITEFTMWAPDPHVRCAVSAALVADASGSMRGEPITAVKRNMVTWFDLMDGMIDEAAMITVQRDAAITQPMTTLKPLLYSAADELRPSGASGLYDGIMEGILHLIDRGYNQCRAVLVFTDGWDNTSTATIQEIISLANRNRIRVFTIGLGYNVAATDLELLALLTGGRFYLNPNAGQISAIYKDISAILFPGFQEPVITYERSCADGTARNIDLQLVDFCGGTDVKSKTYRAPLDSITFSDQYLRIADVVTAPRDVVSVPVVAAELPGVALPFDLTFRNIHPARPMLGVEVPPRSPLHGEALAVNQTSDSIRVRFDGEVAGTAGDTLFSLRFGAAGMSAGTFPIGVRNHGSKIRHCVLTHIESGAYRIVPEQPLRILTGDGHPAADTVFICPDGSTTLSALEGYQSYHWSTGDTTRTIPADVEGTYGLRTTNDRGDTLHADPVTVRTYPRRDVRIEASGPLTFCKDGSVELSVAGDTARTRTIWKTGHELTTLRVRAPGEYWAEVEDVHGCRHPTDTVLVTMVVPPVHFNVEGDEVYVCPGDSIELRVEEEYPYYRWNKGDTTRSVWAKPAEGWQGNIYAVVVRDAQGCESYTHRINVKKSVPRELRLLPSKEIALCSGHEIAVEAAGEFAAFRWSTGDTTLSIAVRDTGTYTVEGLSAEGCVTMAELRVVAGDAPVVRIMPVTAPVLCGDAPIRLDAGEEFVSYHWSTGDTTRYADVDKPGLVWVDVTSYGGCTGRSDTFTVVREMDEWPEISASAYPVICPGDSIHLSAPPGYAEYIWNTGDSTESIVVHADGVYVVSVLTAGGCEGSSMPVRVTVRHPVPPMITRRGNVLSTTDRVLAHQWFLDGDAIPGATTNTLSIAETGSYHVQVIDSCGAVLMSDTLVVTTTTVARMPAQPRIEVYPEPNKGIVHIEAQGLRGPVRAELYDLLGRRVVEMRFGSRGAEAVHGVLEFPAAPGGMYILRVVSARGVLVRRILKR